MKLKTPQLANEAPDVFSPKAYIPAEDGLVTVEDPAIENRGVAFGLATRITPPRDRSAL